MTTCSTANSCASSAPRRTAVRTSGVPGGRPPDRPGQPRLLVRAVDRAGSASRGPGRPGGCSRTRADRSAGLSAGLELPACGRFHVDGGARGSPAGGVQPPDGRRLRKGAALLDTPPEIIEIAYEDTTLPGYFFAIDTSARPTVILVGGYDACAEELYFFNGASALERGLQRARIRRSGAGRGTTPAGLGDAPGLGERHRAGGGLPAPTSGGGRRADRGDRFESRGTPGPRAASGEHRIAACIADCGTFDMYGTFLSPTARGDAGGLRSGDPETVRVWRCWTRSRCNRPPAGRCDAGCWSTAPHPPTSTSR